MSEASQVVYVQEMPKVTEEPVLAHVMEHRKPIQELVTEHENIVFQEQKNSPIIPDELAEVSADATEQEQHVKFASETDTATGSHEVVPQAPVEVIPEQVQINAEEPYEGQLINAPTPVTESVLHGTPVEVFSVAPTEALPETTLDSPPVFLEITNEDPVNIQSTPAETSPTEIIENEIIDNHYENLEDNLSLSPPELVESPVNEVIASAETVIKPEASRQVVNSLETFETFVESLHDLETSPETLEAVQTKVDKIHELTVALQEAELLEGDLQVEKIEEELVQTFIELFAETGVEISEEQVRKLVQLWIQHDVLNSKDFDEARAELFDDKGMHEILKQFMHGVAYIKEVLESIQARLGRLVIADAQKLSLQS